MRRSLLFPLLILPISVFAEGGLPDKPYIYVMGSAEIEKPADMMTLRFDLVGRASEQSKANRDVQANANKIFTIVKDRKIAESDVIAEDIRSEPEFEKATSTLINVARLLDTKLAGSFKSSCTI